LIWRLRRAADRHPEGAGALRCPLCGGAHGEQERFCERCGVPLGRAVDGSAKGAVGESLRGQARKVNPRYAEGPLVRLQRASNEPEGEMVRALLLDAGIPAVLQRAADRPIPELLAGGPFDIYVAQGGLQAAREALLQVTDRD
jgi:hypothetical protein